MVFAIKENVFVMIIGQENIVIKQHVSIIVMVTEFVMLIEVVIV